MSKYFKLVVVSHLFLTIASTAFAETSIATNGKSVVLTFDLTAENIDLTKPIHFRDSDGQFEIYLIKGKFPVPAPQCKKFIKARMPSTLNGDKTEIKKKRKLFNLIQGIRSDQSKVVNVKLNLNPYVKIKQSQPFEGELQFCNVFFSSETVSQ